MNSHILMMKSELAKTKKRYTENRIKLSLAIDGLLRYANPYFGDDIESVRTDEIKQLAKDMCDIKELLIEDARKIKEIGAMLDE